MWLQVKADHLQYSCLWVGPHSYMIQVKQKTTGAITISKTRKILIVLQAGNFNPLSQGSHWYYHSKFASMCMSSCASVCVGGCFMMQGSSFTGGNHDPSALLCCQAIFSLCCRVCWMCIATSRHASSFCVCEHVKLQMIIGAGGCFRSVKAAAGMLMCILYRWIYKGL